VFPYYCRVHGAGMSGTITVTAAEAAPGAVAPPATAAPPPPSATPAPAPTATPAPAAVVSSSGPATNVNIQDFAHQDLTVQVGTTVVWTNQDGAGHTTTDTQGL